ncbi:MAG: prohibitin family protein [Acidobacteriia bacterium]|jgi:regulator of protease activity HflC (stomatin/prohibitin superfamily)|nr:prohibitin family protein [Terriglobia bacterium]
MEKYVGQEFGLPSGLGKKLLGVVVVIVVLSVLGGSFGTVGAGERGVLLRFGAVTGKILDEGLYLKVPFMEDVVLMSTQIMKYTAPATSSSQDLQVVSTEVTLNYQLDGNQVAEIYRSLRRDYEYRVIQPYIQEAVKSTTANYNAEELITQRPAVRNALQQVVSERLKPLGMNVVQLSITDFQFSSAFQQAIEAKVTAVQQALEAENALQRVEFEAKQQVARARAEAEGLRLQKANITKDLIELRKIEVQGAAVDKWNGVMPTVVTSGGPVPMLDVFSK